MSEYNDYEFTKEYEDEESASSSLEPIEWGSLWSELVDEDWKLGLWILGLTVLFLFICYLGRCCYLVWDCCTDPFWGYCPSCEGCRPCMSLTCCESDRKGRGRRRKNETKIVKNSQNGGGQTKSDRKSLIEQPHNDPNRYKDTARIVSANNRIDTEKLRRELAQGDEGQKSPKKNHPEVAIKKPSKKISGISTDEADALITAEEVVNAASMAPKSMNGPREHQTAMTADDELRRLETEFDYLRIEDEVRPQVYQHHFFNLKSIFGIGKSKCEYSLTDMEMKNELLQQQQQKSDEIKPIIRDNSVIVAKSPPENNNFDTSFSGQSFGTSSSFNSAKIFPNNQNNPQINNQSNQNNNSNLNNGNGLINTSVGGDSVGGSKLMIDHGHVGKYHPLDTGEFVVITRRSRSQHQLPLDSSKRRSRSMESFGQRIAKQSARATSTLNNSKTETGSISGTATGGNSSGVHGLPPRPHSRVDTAVGTNEGRFMCDKFSQTDIRRASSEESIDFRLQQKSNLWDEQTKANTTNNTFTRSGHSANQSLNGDALSGKDLMTSYNGSSYYSVGRDGRIVYHRRNPVNYEPPNYGVERELLFGKETTILQ